MSGPDRAQPFVIRLTVGDVTRAEATVLVVNHFTGVAPGGAEGAIDQALGGAISRLAVRGALDSRFGASQFLPTSSAPLAAQAVLLLGLGEPERFDPQRLPELGAAVVEAAAAFRIRDMATILHGAGLARVSREEAAERFVRGLLDALEVVPGADCLREITIVVHRAEHLPEVTRGVRAATDGRRAHVHVGSAETALSKDQPGADRRMGDAAERRLAAVSATEALPQHLRIGITRVDTSLKVTVIGEEAYDLAGKTLYPLEALTNLLRDLAHQVFSAQDGNVRSAMLQAIGAQLYNEFLALPTLDIAAMLRENRDRYLVLRVDQSTGELPWEILFCDGAFVSRSTIMGRQIEIPGRRERVAALPPPHSTLNVLVIGNPTGDLEAAQREASAVVEGLKDFPGAQVRALIGGVTGDGVSREDLSEELNRMPYDVLHYAGHAEFDATRGGALVLKDDVRLTAADLSTRQYLPRLFFANSCYSAQMEDGGTPDAFSGARPIRDLVTGLLGAGVRVFVGSQWAVHDVAAATFALAFYRALIPLPATALNAGVPVGSAVRSAREAVIREHGDGEHTWAAYTLYGSPWTPAL